MPINNLNNVLLSFQLDQSNYDTVNTRFLDASKFNNHLYLKDGTPAWATVAGSEGVLLNNLFYFELDNFPCIPKGSFIYAVNLSGSLADGVLDSFRWFKGAEVAGDHAVNSYDPSIDPTATSIRDQAIQTYGVRIRFFDGNGASIDVTQVADTWYIVTGAVSLLPVKLRQNINGGVFTETTTGTVLNTFGDILRMGYSKAGYPTALSDALIRVGEIHFFKDDVSQQAGYSAFIDELKTKYGI